MSWKNYKKIYHRNRLAKRLYDVNWSDATDFIDEGSKVTFKVTRTYIRREPQTNAYGYVVAFNDVEYTRTHTYFDPHATMNNLSNEELWRLEGRAEKENGQIRRRAVSAGGYHHRHQFPELSYTRPIERKLCHDLLYSDDYERDGMGIPDKVVGLGWD